MLAICACGSRTELDAFHEAGPCSPAAREITIPITTPWTDTGIDVTAGRAVVFSAVLCSVVGVLVGLAAAIRGGRA